jgi:hypothetical protein
MAPLSMRVASACLRIDLVAKQGSYGGPLSFESDRRGDIVVGLARHEVGRGGLDDSVELGDEGGSAMRLESPFQLMGFFYPPPPA